MQIIAAIEKEAHSLKTQAKRNYSYCCGLLVMLTRICQRCCPPVYMTTSTE